MQRQTVVSQFYQMDKLVVEGGKTVSRNFRVDIYLRVLTMSRGSRQAKRVESGEKRNTIEEYENEEINSKRPLSIALGYFTVAQAPPRNELSTDTFKVIQMVLKHRVQYEM